MTPPGGETIGYNGTGTFTQTGGTNTASGVLYLGFQTGSTGTYSLERHRLAFQQRHCIRRLQRHGKLQPDRRYEHNCRREFPSHWPERRFDGSYTLGGTGTLTDNGSGIGGEYVGYDSTGMFTQTGGMNTIAGGFSLLVGAVQRIEWDLRAERHGHALGRRRRVHRLQQHGNIQPERRNEHAHGGQRASCRWFQRIDRDIQR